MVAQILWLASYPKSGNTWLRAFLVNYLLGADKPAPLDVLGRHVLGDMDAWPYERILGGPVVDRPVEEIYGVRSQAHRLLAEQRPGIVPVKTHVQVRRFAGVPTITPEVTFGAIYVVRNPLDVVISFADHYGVTVDQAIEASGAPVHFAGGVGPVIPQDLGSWSGHVRSWTRARGLYRLVLRYEDMLADPLGAFGRVVAFLRHRADTERLEKAVRFSSFKELSTQESAAGFAERSQNSRRFFRKGRAGGWRKALSTRQVSRVIALHGPVMGEHGYLDQRGKAVA